MAWVVARVSLALYLIASALAGYDFRKLVSWEVGLRLVFAILVLMRDPVLAVPAIIIALAYIMWHRFSAKSGDKEQVA